MKIAGLNNARAIVGKKPKMWIALAAIFFVALYIVISSFNSTPPEKKVSISTDVGVKPGATASPPRDLRPVTPQDAAKEVSEEYKKTLGDFQAKQRNANESSGRTYIQNVEASQWNPVTPKPAVEAKDKVEQNTGVSSTSTVERTYVQLTEEETKRLVAQKVQYLKGMTKGLLVKPGDAIDFKTDDNEVSASGAQASSAGTRSARYATIESRRQGSTGSTQPETVSEKPFVGFVPGDYVMGTLDQGVKTDGSKVVSMTIAAGPLAGGKIMLEPTRVDDVVVFQTDWLSWNRHFTKVKGIALDPGDVSTNQFADDVDYHSFVRWGALFASSILEGIGDSAARAGTEVSVNGDQVVQTTSYPVSAYLLSGLGKLGQRAAPIAAQIFNTPPTVRVNSHRRIIVMMVDPVEVPWMPDSKH